MSDILDETVAIVATRAEWLEYLKSPNLRDAIGLCNFDTQMRKGNKLPYNPDIRVYRAASEVREP